MFFSSTAWCIATHLHDGGVVLAVGQHGHLERVVLRELDVVSVRRVDPLRGAQLQQLPHQLKPRTGSVTAALLPNAENARTFGRASWVDTPRGQELVRRYTAVILSHSSVSMYRNLTGTRWAVKFVCVNFWTEGKHSATFRKYVHTLNRSDRNAY